MEVSMDGLRRRLISDYNSLTQKLNSKASKESWNTEICIDSDYIQREMDGLRNAIVTLSFCYIEGQDGFKAMDENTHFENFMPEDEE